MHPRIALARFLIRLGRFVSSLALMVMRPDDLLEFGRQTYAQQQEITFWGSEEMINEGLTPLEEQVLENIPLTEGKVLVLFMGGGREAIPLAKMGFSVTGLEYIPELVEMAKENAKKHGVHLDARLGDLYHFESNPASFDLVWLSSSMYSSIPTRKRRIEILRKMAEYLRPGGWFACMFYWYPTPRFSPSVDWVRKFFAFLTLGNLSYEPGDVLLGETEFIHGFKDEVELSSEFAEAGFELAHPLIFRELEHRGVALLQKAA